jgi:Viral BACON domain/Trypsin-like peptidase domain
MTPRLSIRTSIAFIFTIFCFASLLKAQPRARKEPAIYHGPGVSPKPVDRTQPPSRSNALARPGSLALGGLSPAERSKIGAVGLMQRVGVHREIPEGSLDRGTWTPLGNGHVWRLAIQSDSATGLRVEFSNFSVGDGKVWVHSATTVDGPYTGRGPYGNGEFWSGTVDGESAVIEFEAAGGIANSSLVNNAPPFHVHRIAHESFNPRAPGALLFSPSATQGDDPAALCNLDVNCYKDWLTTKKSVAHIQFEETSGPEQGTFLCSASLAGTRDNSFTPYLLTAGHCIHDEAAARSLQTFWAYESPGCGLGQPADRGSLNSQNGGHLLGWAPIDKGDYSLVLLPNVPQGVVFSGWDPNDPDVGTPLVGIHHPMGSYKRISFGHTTDSVDVFVGNDFAPGGYYHDVLYDLGITQPGSSGSPLFSSPGVIVGMLTYGPAEPGEVACANGDFGGYGKFSLAYAALQAFFEDLPFSEVTPSATNINFTGLNHAITGSSTQTITLTTQSAQPVHFSINSDAPWISVSPSSGTISNSSPAKIQVTVNPSYFLQTDTYTAPLTVLSGAAPPLYVNVNVKMVINTSNVVASAIPAVVAQSGNSWTVTLALQETNGTATTVTTMRIDGADYSGSIASFFGTNKIPANGLITATVHTSGLIPPVTKFFEFFGKDVLSGATWYRMVPVTFNP